MFKKIPFLLCFLLWFQHDAEAQTEVFMQNGRVRVCKGVFKDSEKGKTKGDYDHNENYTLTLSVPGAKNIKLVFKSFCTEKDHDILRIFDGKDTFAALLGKWSGSKGPGTITSKDSFITIHFKTDKSVACYGWEADIITTIIPPPTPVFTLNGTVKCNAVTFKVNSNRAIPCDSIKAILASLTGPPGGIGITSITPDNCLAGKATIFTVNTTTPLVLNGAYSFQLNVYWKDFCDSVYLTNSRLNFSISDCPLKVILKADSDTLCKGSCTFLRATVSGGNVSKYVYTWTPSLTGAGPHRICPTASTRYILRVTDGSSIPAEDTVDIAVLDPPAAMADTEVCYYGPNIFLRATPAGGKWLGTGIVNATTGEFRPSVFWGKCKVWYQYGKCADTVFVNTTAPWNLENVFCPGKPPQAVWWFGPAGGTWSGPKITPAGIFNPDVPGIYRDTYTWKGCISVKTIRVENMVVPKFDTTCESRTADTLTFSPKGIFPNWFPGLSNSYWGWYNPSQTGGAGTKLIIWNAGGCRDTTRLTVLPVEAGPNDTFCPSAGAKILAGFRPSLNYTWSGRGIVSPTLPDYNPAFFSSMGKTTYIDTLTIRNGVCTDRKFVYLIPTKINKKDTQFFCIETPLRLLNNALVGLNPDGGFWTGPGITGINGFNASLAGFGHHKLVYNKNGCTDTINAYVRPRPTAQSDTAVCINTSPFNCRAGEAGGTFSGKGIVSATLGTFSPTVAGAGNHTITFRNKWGCTATFTVRVDAPPALSFINPVTDYCFQNKAYLLTANLPGGAFSGRGVTGNNFNPFLAGSGKHTISYTLMSGACTASTSIDVIVSDTLKVSVNPPRDTICPGEIVWLRASAFGGDKFSYFFSWSNGQTGNGTFVSPAASTNYTITVTDGCSEPAIATVPIYRHHRPYFSVTTSPPVCFGQKGWIKLRMKDGDPYRYIWDVSPVYFGDSLSAMSGNLYRVTAENLKTGCITDTSIEIPGYKAITAAFMGSIPNGLPCLSPIYPTLRIFNNCVGAVSGTWNWGDGSSEPFDPALSPKHTYSGEFAQYKVKLRVQNAGSCTDSTEQIFCYRDTVVYYIPNAFTPNNDGFNDKLEPAVIGAVEFEMLIYNRWGQIVFKTANPAHYWDGTVNGNPCPEGLYAYRIKYKGRKTANRQDKGSVLLLRPKN